MVENYTIFDEDGNILGTHSERESGSKLEFAGKLRRVYRDIESCCLAVVVPRSEYKRFNPELAKQPTSNLDTRIVEREFADGQKAIFAEYGQQQWNDRLELDGWAWNRLVGPLKFTVGNGYTRESAIEEAKANLKDYVNTQKSMEVVRETVVGVEVV